MSQAGMVYPSNQEYLYQNFQPTDRFHVRSSVYLPGGDVDPDTGMLRSDGRRAGRTQAMRMEAQRLDLEFAKMHAAVQARKDEKGIWMQLRYAVLLAFSVAMFFALVLLVQQGMLTQRLRNLQEMQQTITSIQTENTGIQAQIDEASDSATICYAAAQDLGMIPANSTQAIHLTAVDTRPSESGTFVSASADVKNEYTAGTE